MHYTHIPGTRHKGSGCGQRKYEERTSTLSKCNAEIAFFGHIGCEFFSKLLARNLCLVNVWMRECGWMATLWKQKGRFLHSYPCSKSVLDVKPSASCVTSNCPVVVDHCTSLQTNTGQSRNTERSLRVQSSPQAWMGRVICLTHIQSRVAIGCSATWRKANTFPFPWVIRSSLDGASSGTVPPTSVTTPSIQIGVDQAGAKG